MSLNRSVLVGRLVKDPELRYSPNGVAVCNFTVAVNRTFSKENEADFINCVCFKKSAENLANFQRKGNLIGVDGRIQTRSFDGQDGKKVYVTEVVADSVQFLESKKDGQSSNQSNSQGNDPFKDNGEPINIKDSDLPF